MKIIQMFGTLLIVSLSFGALAQENKALTQQQMDSIAQASDEIYDLVEVMPQFPGGVDSLKAFIDKNMVYPALAKEYKIAGTVYVSVVVETDGSLSNIEVKRGIGGGCDEEAQRIIRNMPRWIPGTQRGIQVRTRCNIPFIFKLK